MIKPLLMTLIWILDSPPVQGLLSPVMNETASNISSTTEPFCFNCIISCLIKPGNWSSDVQQTSICDGSIECYNVTPCDVGCHQYYRCQRTNKCVPRDTICDGNTCNGCEEDNEWQRGIGFQCVRDGKYCILPQQLLYDGVKDCDGGEDLCLLSPHPIKNDPRDLRQLSGTELDESKCFECLDHSMIIPRDKVCDEVIDCSDQSDECLCEAGVPSICQFIRTWYPDSNQPCDVTQCKIGQVSCGKGRCIERSMICDSFPQCPDKRDERYEFCRGTLQCRHAGLADVSHNCRCEVQSRSCKVESGIACDSIAQCPGPYVGNGRLDGNWYNYDDECNSHCKHKQCNNAPHSAVSSGVGGLSCHEIIWFNGTAILVPKDVDSFKWCDGVLDCHFGEDEFTEYVSCNESRYFCDTYNGKVSIPRSAVCDGAVDCITGVDESPTMCPGRFFCNVLSGTKISIEKQHICDYNVNCDNGEDELNCTDGRFYCENQKPPFVMKSKILNGRADCSDWSDECPSSHINRLDNVLSSRYHLIGNVVLRVFVWIMGILAVGGNLVVIVGEVVTCKRLGDRGAASLRANHILVLNLALADLLMGVYLIALGGVGVTYQGRYCIMSYAWMTSTMCSSMGVLVVVSSETSVLTMVVLTSIRMYATFKPFSSNSKPELKLILLLASATWLLSITIATIPFAPSLQRLFVERAWIRGNPFFQNEMVNLEAGKTFIRRLVSYDTHFSNKSSELFDLMATPRSWEDLLNILSRDPAGDHYFNITGYFGYYSGNSVCIPKLYVHPSDPAWVFSLCISTFNFLAFIFVLSAYIAIYMKSRRSIILQTSSASQKSAISKKQAAIQRKIIRLVVTDFCCWVPISIMAFLSIGGYELPNVVYAISAIILLPINSALNPLLYSNFVDKLIDQIKPEAKSQEHSQSSEALATSKL